MKMVWERVVIQKARRPWKQLLEHRQHSLFRHILTLCLLTGPLTSMSAKMSEVVAKGFFDLLLNLKSVERFPNGYKLTIQ